MRLSDVLSGEVWIASGQSNMEWIVGMSAGAEREVAEAHHPQLRCLFVTRTPSLSPAAHVECQWRKISPETVSDVTAVGYFFARELQRELRLPVGFIDAAWGGTRVEALRVRCDRAAAPVAVRCAFRDFVDVNLVNATGLPAEPFRTDVGV